MTCVVEIFGYVLNLASFALMMTACLQPYWEVGDNSNRVDQSIVHSTGLWMQCVTQNTGDWHCSYYDTFFLDLEKREK